MKNWLAVLIHLLVTGVLYGQAALSYSGVVRGKSGIPLKMKNVGIQVILQKHSATGPVIYQENHLVTTDYFGAYSIEIGNGTPLRGKCDTIDWSADNYFIKVGIDTNGKKAFVFSAGATMLHIPVVIKERSHQQNGLKLPVKKFQHFMGERFGGGVIFDLWMDEGGREHGLIVSLKDLKDSIAWSVPDRLEVGGASRDMDDGAKNTSSTIAAGKFKESAARLCRSYNWGGFDDWYLPAVHEFNLLMANYDLIMSKLDMPVSSKIYWCSTEYNNEDAWAFAIYGQPSNNYIFSKYSLLSVRAIRSF